MLWIVLLLVIAFLASSGKKRADVNMEAASSPAEGVTHGCAGMFYIFVLGLALIAALLATVGTFPHLFLPS